MFPLECLQAFPSFAQPSPSPLLGQAGFRTRHHRRSQVRFLLAFWLYITYWSRTRATEGRKDVKLTLPSTPSLSSSFLQVLASLLFRRLLYALPTGSREGSFSSNTSTARSVFAEGSERRRRRGEARDQTDLLLPSADPFSLFPSLSHGSNHNYFRTSRSQ